MRKRNKKVYDDDDGRVVSSMNVEGMPWHNEKASPSSQVPKAESGSEDDELQLTQTERRAMMGGVFAAALLVAGIFVAAGLLFILFCAYVWLG